MNDCIFCKIIDGEVPSTVVFENDYVIVIKDINPKAPTHLLIIPKRHIENLFYVDFDHKEDLAHILLAAKDIAKQLQINEEGFKLSVSNGRNAGQEVDHLHFHFLSDKK